MATVSLPWAPLFSIHRSGRLELTLYGALAVFVPLPDNALSGRLLFSAGDADVSLWSRSLLKPWQLLNIMPDLKAAHPDLPDLTDEQLAVLMASHQGESAQVHLIESLLNRLGDVSALKCPACYPMSPEEALALQQAKTARQAIYHPCSGKHAGHLLALKAHHADPADYLSPDNRLYDRLKTLLTRLLNTTPDAFPATVDGCGMPNYPIPLSAMAGLFSALLKPLPAKFIAHAPKDIQPVLAHWPEIARLMRAYPHLIGGQNRLDTRLMMGKLTTDGMSLIAKEGADGLLGVGIAPCQQYPDGLGVAIKLSAGYEPKYLEIVIRRVLEQLGLSAPVPPESTNDTLLTHEFHIGFPAGMSSHA